MIRVKHRRHSGIRLSSLTGRCLRPRRISFRCPQFPTETDDFVKYRLLSYRVYLVMAFTLKVGLCLSCEWWYSGSQVSASNLREFC